MSYHAFRSEEDGFETVHLIDERTELEAVVAPRFGNNTISLKLRGREFLWRPNRTLTDMFASHVLFGIPFLAPWANRLSLFEYEVGGRSYHLNPDLGNVRYDHHGQAIHGLLLFAPWKVTEVRATADGAELISKLHFTSCPSLMAQFPFAHSLEMRHRVTNGRFHVHVRIISECEESFPVSIGFHPYYTIPDSHRDDWQLQLAGRSHFELNTKQTPTGRVSRVEALEIQVRDVELDDVYSDLVRNTDGVAEFRVESGKGSLVTGFGPGYTVSVVYAPRTGDFVCIEPMVSVTDALHLQNSDSRLTLPLVHPGSAWEGEFWVEPRL